MNRQHLLVINTGSLSKRFIFQKLKDLGVVVTVVHKETNWAADLVSDWILVDTSDHTATLAAVKNYLTQHEIDGVATFWEDDVLITSILVERLGLKGVPNTIAQITRDKYRFREFCKQHDLPRVKHFLINSLEELHSVASQLQFPVVFKPTFGAHSAFVVKANSMTDAEQTYQFLQQNISAEVESALGSSRQLMVEEYIDGAEVDVDMVWQHGQLKYWSISDNHQTNEPFFMESGYALPSQLTETEQNDLVNMAKQVVTQLGISDGIIHFEAKSSSRGPIPLEVNLRMGGDEVYSSNKLVWNCDLVEATVAVACGTEWPSLDPNRQPQMYIAGMSLVPEKSGVLTQLELPSYLPPFVKNLVFEYQVGDQIWAPPDSFEFLGWLTVSGETPAEASSNLEQMLRQIKYHITPTTPNRGASDLPGSQARQSLLGL